MDRIIDYVKGKPDGVEKKELANHCNILPSKLDKYLTGHPDFTLIDNRWIYTNASYSEDQPHVMVIIDLGNVHDCLQKIVPYVESRSCDVRAYADKMSNCYGIKPRINNKHIDIRIASDSHRNAADIEMVWDCATLSPTYSYVCLVTKDLGFQTLVTKLRQDGRKVDLVHSWEELSVIFSTI
jgi:hypothetical protein